MLATDQKLDRANLSPTSLAFLAFRDRVVERWAAEVRARVAGAQELLTPVLVDTMPAFYDNLVEALTPTCPRNLATAHNDAATAHGGERARMTGFGPDQIVHEYQILRETIAVVAAGNVDLSADDWRVIDASINAAIMEAVRAFMEMHRAARRQWSATLSHDMRTPLDIIANGAELIGLTLDLHAAKRAGARIKANAQRLSAMMDELLDSLTDAGVPKLALSLTCFDMQNLVTDVANAFSEGTDARLALACQKIEGYWCETAMRRALENLISNALKYGDGQCVTLKADEQMGRLILSVHNTGSYLPKDSHGRIFDYLQRESSHAAARGWGIGLQFVKSVAEGHGGSVSVDSSSDAGTTFIIDVPIDCRPFAAP